MFEVVCKVTRAEPIPVFYAYSKRVSEEEQQADGSVKKVVKFVHEKFIKV